MIATPFSVCDSMRLMSFTFDESAYSLYVVIRRSTSLESIPL
jgi:hypothetical protein